MKRYCNVMSVPKSIGKGRKLHHNHVRHTVNMPQGLNGFRGWTDSKRTTRKFKKCGCGWSGLPHYSLVPDYKCETFDELRAAQEREFGRALPHIVVQG